MLITWKQFIGLTNQTKGVYIRKLSTERTLNFIDLTRIWQKRCFVPKITCRKVAIAKRFCTALDLTKRPAEWILSVNKREKWVEWLKHWNLKEVRKGYFYQQRLAKY